MSIVPNSRERVISLTYTEIMLVIAAALLILLTLKSLELSDANASIAELETEAMFEDSKDEKDYQAGYESALEELQEAEAELEKAQDELSQLQDMQQRIENTLEKVSSSAPAAGTASSSLAPAITGSGSDSGTDAKDLDERIEEVLEKVAEAKDKSDSYDALLQSGVGGGDEAVLSQQVSVLQEQVVEQHREIARLETRLEIGFIPCWPGPGNPKYYKTYDATYNRADGTYVFGLNSDVGKPVRVIQDSMRGHLAKIHDLPRGTSVSKRQLENFGKQLVASARAQFRGQPDKEDCKLAATINEAATGVEIKFLRDVVGLYPVYR